MDIDQVIAGVHPLPLPSLQTLRAKFSQVSLPKGHLLLQAERLERSVYFVSKGIVRAYANAHHGQATFWFGQEGSPVLSMQSYINGEKSYETVELLEDCLLFKIRIAEMRSLFNEDIDLANWGRKLAEQELLKVEERLIGMQFKTASQRYADLIEQNPALIKRFSLRHIASYLGMSQVSLSRIRARVQ